MKIKNPTTSKYFYEIVFWGVFCVIFSVILILGFNYFVEMLFSEYFIGAVIFFLFPTISFICFLYNLKKGLDYRKKFYSNLNLKSVELLKDKIHFKFTQNTYDIICDYSEIKYVELKINTARPVYPDAFIKKYIRSLEIRFVLSNDKEFLVSLPRKKFATPRNYLNLISKIFKHLNNKTNISYDYTGLGEIPAITEQIERFKHNKSGGLLPAEISILKGILTTTLFFGVMFCLVYSNNTFCLYFGILLTIFIFIPWAISFAKK